MNVFPQGDLTFEMLTEHVLGALDGYVAWTEYVAKTALAQMRLEDSLPRSSKEAVVQIRDAIIAFVSPGWESKLEAVVNSYVLPEFTPVAVSPPAPVAVAPQLVVDTAAPAASGTLPATLIFGDPSGDTSGDESRMSAAVLSPPRTANASSTGSPSGTPPPRPSGSASDFGALVSPPAKPPGPRGGFKFTLGKRPDWL